MVRAMRIALLPCLALCACTSFPALEGTISDAARDAPYPTLTAVPMAPPVSGADADALQARIAALNARAARLRQIDIGALQ